MQESQSERTPPNPNRARDHLANERTYLAWIRTAVSLMGFGVLIVKLRFTHTADAPGGRHFALHHRRELGDGLPCPLRDVRAGLPLAPAFTVAAIAGLAVGMVLSRHMKPTGLKTTFGGLSLGVAPYLIVMNIQPVMKLVAG